MTNSSPALRLVTLLAGVVCALALLAVPAGAATIAPLHSGSATGAENYLYTAGDQVFTGTPTSLAPTDAYRFEVIAPDGSVKHTLGTCFSGNAAAGDSYTIGATDPASGAAGYQWVLEDFNPGNKGANLTACNAAAPGTGTVVARRYFDVVVPSVDGTTSFSGNQRLFASGQPAYARFAGVANRNPDTGAVSAIATGASAPQWNVRWLNGVSTACSNTGGADRPDSSLTGALPASTPGYLQFPPSSGASGVFNDALSYDGLCSTGTGSYSAELRLVPASGDPNQSKQFVQVPLFNIDATAPALTLNAPGDTHLTTPSFSGAAGSQAASSTAFADVASVTINIYSGATTSGSPIRTFTKAPAAGSWSLSSSDWAAQSQAALPQGIYTVEAVQSDGGGNTARQSVAFKVDTVAPSVTLTAPVGGSELSDTTPAFAGAAGNGGALSNATADLQTVTLRIYGGHSATGTAVRTIPVTKTGDQWSVGDQQWSDNGQTALGAGTYTAQAEQFDGAGNQGLSGSVTFKVDPLPPTVTITAPADGLNTTGATPAIAGTSGIAGSTDTTSADLAPITVDVYSGPDTSGAPQRTFTVNGAGGSWAVGSADWAAQGALTQGQWTVQARQSDSAGNVGTSSARTFRVDQQAPFSGTSVTGATNQPSITVSYTDADLGSSQSGVGQVALYAKGPGDSGFAQVAATSNPAASGTFTYTAAKGQGRYFFATVATDNAGNAEPTPDDAGPGKAFTHYDTSAPAVTLDTWPATGNDTTPGLSGTAGSNSGNAEPAADSPTVTVDVWSGTDTNQIPARSISVTRASDGSWALDDSAWNIADPARAPLTEGTWTARARQSDEAGNTGTSGTPRTIVVDLHAPQSSDDVPTTWQKDPVQAHLSATDSGGGSVAAIHYTIDGSTPTVASPSYSSAITLGNGQSIRYFAVDTAGNAEAVHASPAAMVDTHAPVTTDDVPATWQSHEVTATLTPTDPDSGVAATYYTTDGSTPTTASTPYTTPVTLSDGQAIRYFSVDAAGNAESVKTSNAARVDTSAPTSQAGAPAYADTQTFTVPYSAGDSGSGLKTVELWAKAPGDADYSLYATDSTPAATGSFQYTGAADGDYSFYTRATDNVDNSETVDTAGTQVTTTQLDTAAPTTTDDAPASYVNHDVSVTLSASDNPGGAGVAVTRYTTDGSTPTDSSPAYTVPITLTSDGQQLKYFSVDHAGNRETVRTATVHIDRAAPSTQASAPASPRNSASFSIGYSADDAAPTSGLDHVELYAKGPNDSDYSKVDDDTSPADGHTFGYSATQGEGTYRFYTLGYDHVGNAEAFDSSHVVPVVLDTTPPQLSLAAIASLLSDDTPHVSGSSDDPAAVTVNVYAGSAATGTALQSPSTTVSGGSWALDLAQLADGTYTIQAQQTDAAGNGVTSSAQTFRLDAHAPSITSANQGQSYAQNASVAADYTCADEPGGSGVDSCSGDVARGAPLDTATPGPHSYRVTARDRAGNELGSTISYTVAEQHVQGDRQDTQPPDVSSAGTRRSQALSGGALSLDLVCSEQCDVNAGGTISVPGAARVYKLRTVARKGTAGAHVKLKLKLDKRTLKAVRKAIKKHRKVVAKVKLTATDAGGNRRTSTLSVRITRA